MTPKPFKPSNLQLKVMKIFPREWGYYLTFRAMAKKARITPREARLAARALKRAGMTEHGSFWYEDSGELGGSGYSLTPAGLRWLKEQGL